MTRTIKASDIKPGMTIRWEHKGIKYECKTDTNSKSAVGGWAYVCTTQGGDTHIPAGSPVTVLSEPQPEEPMVHGAGQVTIIDADPSWTVPEATPVDAPTVPDRIEEWPEDDTALRGHRWKDTYGNTLDWNRHEWRKTTPRGYSFPVDAAFQIDVPCTRDNA